jgi:cell division protease FtsH
MSILKKHRKQLDTLAKGLLEYETLSGQEIVDLLDGKVPLRD